MIKGDFLVTAQPASGLHAVNPVSSGAGEWQGLNGRRELFC
jgi:hypothetical protein